MTLLERSCILYCLLWSSCGHTDAPRGPVEPAEHRFQTITAEGDEITVWISSRPDETGERMVSVTVDDPQEPEQRSYNSIAKATDSLRVLRTGADGRSVDLLRGRMVEGKFMLHYAPADRKALDLVFTEAPDELVATVLHFKKVIEPVAQPKALEDGGYEEMGIDETGQTIEVNTLRLMERSTGKPHILDRLLEEQFCGRSGSYVEFMERKVGSSSWYEGAASFHHRGKDHVVFRISSHEQWPGAAHGMFGSRFVNCDRHTGEVFGLWDMVDRRKRNKLVTLCSKAFYAEHPETSTKDYPFKLSENVAVLPNGLQFHYQPYEMGSFAEGEKSMLVPYSTIADLLVKGKDRVRKLAGEGK